MTQTPYSYPGHMMSYVVVCEGGSIQDPPPDKSGTMKVIDPLRHHPNMSRQQLPFITMLHGPTMESQECTNHPPDPGSVLACSFNMGDPSSRTVWGQPNEINNASPMAGNMSLAQHVQQTMMTDTRKVVSQGTQQKSRSGAIIKEAKNGPNWKHVLSKYLPTHAAPYAAAGTRIKPLKGIDTAVQQFTGSFNAMGGLGAIAGQLASLSSLLSSFSSSQKKKLKSSMPPEIYGALESMSVIMMDDSGAGDHLAGEQADPETFANNAINMLSQCKSLLDLDDCMGRLQYDTSLYGQDKLQDVVMEVETDFGNTKVKMSSSGSVTPMDPAAIISAIQSFGSFLSSAGSNPSLGSLMNQFGGNAAKMAQLGGRVNPAFGSLMNAVMKNGGNLGSGLSNIAANFPHAGGLPPYVSRFFKGVKIPAVAANMAGKFGIKLG